MEALEKHESFERKPFFPPRSDWNVHIFKEGDVVGSQKVDVGQNLNIGRDLIKNDDSIDRHYVSHQQLTFEPLERDGGLFVRITNTGKNSV